MLDQKNKFIERKTTKNKLCIKPLHSLQSKSKALVRAARQVSIIKIGNDGI